jgi:hypothetical protein
MIEYDVVVSTFDVAHLRPKGDGTFPHPKTLCGNTTGGWTWWRTLPTDEVETYMQSVQRNDGLPPCSRCLTAVRKEGTR